MALLTIIAIPCLASVVYLTAAALVRRGNQVSPRARLFLMSTAAVLAVAAIGVVATNNARDAVLGFAIGGILTPMIANHA